MPCFLFWRWRFSLMDDLHFIIFFFLLATLTGTCFRSCFSSPGAKSHLLCSFPHVLSIPPPASFPPSLSILINPSPLCPLGDSNNTALPLQGPGDGPRCNLCLHKVNLAEDGKVVARVGVSATLQWCGDVVVKIMMVVSTVGSPLTTDLLFCFTSLSGI